MKSILWPRAYAQFMLGNILTVNQSLDHLERWEGTTDEEQLYSDMRKWVEAQPKIPTERITAAGGLIAAAMIFFGAASSMWLQWLTATLAVLSIIFLIGASLWALRERDGYMRRFIAVIYERDDLATKLDREARLLQFRADRRLRFRLVGEHWEKHPDKTEEQVARDLNLSVKTVQRAMDALDGKEPN